MATPIDAARPAHGAEQGSATSSLPPAMDINVFAFHASQRQKVTAAFWHGLR